MLKKDAQYNGHLTSFAKLPPQLASFLSYSLCTKTLTCQINVPRYSFLLFLKIYWGFLLPKIVNVFSFIESFLESVPVLTLFWEVWQKVLLIQKLRNFRKKPSPNSLKLRVESLEQGLSQTFYKSIKTSDILNVQQDKNMLKIWDVFFHVSSVQSWKHRFLPGMCLPNRSGGDRFLGQKKGK